MKVQCYGTSSEKKKKKGMILFVSIFKGVNSLSGLLPLRWIKGEGFGKLHGKQQPYTSLC